MLYLMIFEFGDKRFILNSADINIFLSIKFSHVVEKCMNMENNGVETVGRRIVIGWRRASRRPPREVARCRSRKSSDSTSTLCVRKNIIRQRRTHSPSHPLFVGPLAPTHSCCRLYDHQVNRTGYLFHHTC